MYNLKLNPTTMYLFQDHRYSSEVGNVFTDSSVNIQDIIARGLTSDTVNISFIQYLLFLLKFFNKGVKHESS